MKRLIPFCFIVTLLYSCQNSADKGKVLAKVGSTVITEDYLNSKIAEVSPDPDSYLNTGPGKKQFLDMLINERLVKIASENSSSASSKEYKDKVAEMQKQLDDKLKEYKEYLLTRTWLEDLRNKELTVSDKEVEGYYSKYPKAVVIDNVIAPDYAAAERIMKKMKSGIPVAKIVEEEKKNAAVAGGRLPPILPGEFLPELEDMIYKMKPGEIQGGVKTKLGFHVIKKVSEAVLDIKKPEMRERIKKVIEKKKFDDYLAKLQKKYKVEVVDEKYK